MLRAGALPLLYHRMSAGKLNVEKVKYQPRHGWEEEKLLEPLFLGKEGIIQAGPQRQQGQCVYTFPRGHRSFHRL